MTLNIYYIFTLKIILQSQLKFWLETILRCGNFAYFIFQKSETYHLFIFSHADYGITHLFFKTTQVI